ncbi:MAG TPA: DNA internalization-related competence protein ComEC/Rec2, partial [Gammaproteobacteria bacterium]|nr:DNA internalization-related competence protein ComEC/Rec2 [Gammaproteobacteria bacterium]
ISPVANLIAVPVVSLGVVPLVLPGVLLGALGSSLGNWLLQMADQILHGLMWLLEYLGGMSWAAFSLPISSAAALGFAMLAVFLLLLPRGLPGRWLMPLFLLPAVTGTAGLEMRPGQFSVDILDVGQGLATVVMTANHTLVFDTGARFSRRSSAARSVVLPFLKQAGIDHLDVLVLSHDDNDHAGGESVIMRGLTVGRRYFSTSRQKGRESGLVSHCNTGDRWQWDGVDFEFLHPPPGWASGDNNGSCVLKISNAAFGALLPGDIEQPVEKFLLQHEAEKLPSTLLVAPHHGSLTSSSRDFIAQVAPQWVVFSVGYHNRFGFPKPEVVARYRQLGSETLETDRSGGTSFRFGSQPGDLQVQTWRDAHRHWWQPWMPEAENELVDTSATPSFL